MADTFYEVEFPKLINLVYQAALDPAQWQTFLEALTTPFAGASGVFYAVDRECGITDFSYIFGSDPAYMASYTDYYSSINPYGQPSLDMPAGEIFSTTRSVDLETILRSEFYNNWMQPQGLPADHLGVLVQTDGQRGVIMGLAPHDSVFDQQRDRYTKRFAMLVPHMARALEINRVAALALPCIPNFDAALEAFDAAVFVLTSAGRPVRLNARAEALMRHDSVLLLDRNGILYARRPGDNSKLGAAFAKAISAGVRATSGPIRLTSPRDGRAYLAWLLPPPAEKSRPISNVYTAETAAGSSMLLLITPADGAVNIPAALIQPTFGLSSAEARLVSALVAGRTLAEVATDTGVSRNTLRNQLSAIFAKTGTQRQTELVAIVVRALGAMVTPAR